MRSRKGCARRLFEIIVGDARDGYIELRPIKQGAGPRAQSFIPVTDLDRAATLALKGAEATDMFVGCAPRAERNGTKAAIPRSWCVWADIDGPQGIDLLADFPYPPTLTIPSGSPDSLHAWWALKEPLKARYVRQANMRLAWALSEPCPWDHPEPHCGLCHLHRIGADPASCDVARVLRVPGTYNHKTTPPRVVKIETDTGARYDIRTLVGGLPDLEPPKAPVKARQRPPLGQQPLRDIPAVEYYERLTGNAGALKPAKVPCPLHEDWDPSLQLFPDGTWYCYGCTHGGTVYDLAGLMWNMGTKGPEFLALKDRLREEFNLR